MIEECPNFVQDFETCRQADVFIGNHHSLWTKNIPRALLSPCLPALLQLLSSRCHTLFDLLSDMAHFMLYDHKPTWQYSEDGSEKNTELFPMCDPAYHPELCKAIEEEWQRKKAGRTKR